jgi:hypothetical protein
MKRFTSLLLTMGCSFVLAHYAHGSSPADSQPQSSTSDAKAHLTKLDASQAAVSKNLGDLISSLAEKEDHDPKSLTNKDMDALAHLQEIAKMREAIISKAQKEERALTSEEVKMMQDPALDLALNMLTQDSPKIKSLVEALRSSLKLTGAHIDLHADIISGNNEGAERVVAHDTVNLSQTDIDSLKTATKKTDDALAAYVKTLDPATLNDSDTKKALETLKALHGLREQALDKLSNTPTLKASDVQNLHSAEETNAAILALNGATNDRKKARDGLSSALIEFKDSLDKATQPLDKQAAAHPTGSHADEKLNNHHVMIDHHNELADHIKSLEDLLSDKKDATNDHHHALEFLKEEHDRRGQILQKAQDEGRPITHTEAAQIQEGNNGLHVALSLLPEDTDEEKDLKDDIIDGHSDLVDTASHHENLHNPNSDSMKTAPSISAE